MQVGFMITNGGPHPADKWAEQTTEQILALLVDASPDDDTPEARAARKAKRDLRPVLFDIFNDHHDGVQKHERGACAKIKKADHAHDHAHGRHDPEPHKGVMNLVNDALSRTPWAAHFAKSEVQAALWRIVGQHTVNVMHIERRWHHDRLRAKEA